MSFKSASMMGVGTGGASGPPASAVVASTHRSAHAESNLRIAVPPSREGIEQASITPIISKPESLFAHFWKLHTANEPHESLAICDRLLEVIDPSDFASHLRQANGRAMALRSLKRFREAKYVHLAARPLLSAADPRVAGDHHHGLGLTLEGLREYESAFGEMDEAQRLYKADGSAFRLGLVAVNAARLCVSAGRAESAFELIDRASGVDELRADAEVARALAYDALSDKVSARRAIAKALSLLADSHNEASRVEALEVLNRIEGL
jgi:tetratricopeptide (TPR) repeat protein